MIRQPNPYLEVYRAEALEGLLRVLRCEPHPTPALRAAVAVLAEKNWSAHG